MIREGREKHEENLAILRVLRGFSSLSVRPVHGSSHKKAPTRALDYRFGMINLSRPAQPVGVNKSVIDHPSSLSFCSTVDISFKCSAISIKVCWPISGYVISLALNLTKNFTFFPPSSHSRAFFTVMSRWKGEVRGVSRIV